MRNQWKQSFSLKKIHKTNYTQEEKSTTPENEWVITTDPADNETLTNEYHEDFYDNTFDNFVEMNKK